MVYSLKNIKKIYSMCSLIRQVELEIVNRYKEGKMRCPVHLSIGQEIVASVLSIFIKKDDFAVSTHRSHAHYLAKQGSLRKMIAEIYGKRTGCSMGKGGSMHLIDKNVNFMGSTSIVGNSIPIGTGLGFSLKLKKKKNISIIYLGDAATEQGSFYESINFSILKKIPAVYICENNFFSVYSDLKVRQHSKRNIINSLNSLGIKTFKITDYHPVKLVNKMQYIVNYARVNSKPVFIEFLTYRFYEHCGPNIDDNLNYRKKEEIKKWKDKDGYENLKKFLIKKNQKLFIEKVEYLNRKKILNAFKFAEKSKFPNKSDLIDGIYK